jgi:hypothetical protein
VEASVLKFQSEVFPSTVAVPAVQLNGTAGKVAPANVTVLVIPNAPIMAILSMSRLLLRFITTSKIFHV